MAHPMHLAVYAVSFSDHFFVLFPVYSLVTFVYATKIHSSQPKSVTSIRTVYVELPKISSLCTEESTDAFDHSLSW